MKKLLLALSIALFSVTVSAQSAYEKVMTEKISKLEQSKTPEEFQTLADDFTRIGSKEATQWLPNYYAALSYLKKGRTLMQAGKTDELQLYGAAAEKYVEAAKRMVNSGDKIPNAELLILEKMAHSLKMMENPQQKFMTEGPLAAAALENAEKLDPNNPRITLMKAEDTYFTPEQFGGSKEKGLELFKTASDQFKTYKTSSSIAPNWGQSEAEYFLSQK